jgi:hypothetical protein
LSRHIVQKPGLAFTRFVASRENVNVKTEVGHGTMDVRARVTDQEPDVAYGIGEPRTRTHGDFERTKRLLAGTHIRARSENSIFV